MRSNRRSMRNTNQRSRRRTARRRTTRRNTRRRTNRRNTRRTRRNIQSGGMLKRIGGGGGGGGGGDGEPVTPVISPEARMQAGMEEATAAAGGAMSKISRAAKTAQVKASAAASAVARKAAGGDTLGDPRDSELKIEGIFLKKGAGSGGTFKKYRFTFTVNDGILRWTDDTEVNRSILIRSLLNTITPVDTGVELQLFPHDGQAWDESRGVGNPLIFKFSDHFDASIYHSAFMKCKELAGSVGGVGGVGGGGGGAALPSSGSDGE